jgi:hypothetical protein
VFGIRIHIGNQDRCKFQQGKNKYKKLGFLYIFEVPVVLFEELKAFPTA